MKRRSLKAEYDKFTMYHVTGMIRNGTTVLSERVWWKPWTWRRKKVFIGGEWEKMDHTYAAPKGMTLLPITNFVGNIEDISVTEVEDEQS